jgi:putative ABC transport system substrate-binding protein
MKRRKFITLLGGAAAMLPLPAGGQQTSDRGRRIGVLGPLAAADPIESARMAAFRQGLQPLGWSEGRNLRIEYRWSVGGSEELRRYAEELVALAPDAILVTGSAPLAVLRQATRTVPVVFVNVADPVGSGFVTSLARPGGNMTGFTPLEFGTSAKWVELLKEIAPAVTRVGVLREAASPGSMGQFSAIEAATAALRIGLTPIEAVDAAAIESAIDAIARAANSGLIVPAIPSINLHRDLLVALAARHRLPAVYAYRPNVVAGGLMSYGPDQFDLYRRAATYVDRILKGEKPADLPVQAPTKYELVINLKTAKALGLTVPPTMLARADEIIE